MARSELGMLSQGTHGVVFMGSWRFPGHWEGESNGLEVRNLMKSPMHGDGRVTHSFVNLRR